MCTDVCKSAALYASYKKTHIKLVTKKTKPINVLLLNSTNNGNAFKEAMKNNY